MDPGGTSRRYFGSDFLGHHETCCGTIKMTTNKSHPNAETLRAIYADLSCIAEYADDNDADDNVLLHTADRGVAS
jgi:hypothetical protein